MQCQQQQSLHQRILAALTLYEQKKTMKRGIHPQRKKDIEHIKNCLLHIYDKTLLINEIKYYLDRVRTPGYLRSRTGGYSELKEIILSIIRDEESMSIRHMHQIESNQELRDKIDFLEKNFAQWLKFQPQASTSQMPTLTLN